MKRWIALMLALVMAAALAVPAFAETEDEAPEIDTGMMDLEDTVCFLAPEQEQADMQERLEAVTLAVKNTLDVGDAYTDFSGEYRDGISPRWSLYWSMDGRELNVEADEAGKVLSADRWTDSGVSDRFYGFDPAFPSVGRDEAERQADDWLDRLFTGEESGRIDSVRASLGRSGYYIFRGGVLKNGLPSPVSFTLIVDGEGLRSFYRSDSYSGYVGALPAPEPETDEADAAQALAGAVELELRYVSDGEGGARLRYVPVGPYTVVDAGTGEAVDMDALYAAVGGDRGSNEAAMDAEAPEGEAVMAGGGAILTETELASIENYGDVLDQTAIDEALRAVKALGLDGFAMSRCSYALDSDSGDVTATARYAGTMTEEELYGFSSRAFEDAQEQGRDLVIYKTVLLDGKTGQIRSVYTQYPLWERDGDVTMSQRAARRAAENFLKNTVPELAEQSALCTLKGYNEGEDSTVVYARTHEGYFFPENTLTVAVNPSTGTVDSFTVQWDEDVDFAPAEDIVGGEEALDAYIGALDMTLGYVAWPLDVTLEENAVYADSLEWGYTYVEELRLAYFYGGTDSVRGVDALTGEAVTETGADGAFAYDDLDGEDRADMIRALGLAGIGFAGGKFRPEAALTQRDALVLLLQADGSSVDPAEEQWLREQAVRRGFISDEAWDPDGPVSRMALLRMLLGPSRYGAAAELSGVWDAGFKDVDEADAPYAAIARALGLAEGETLEPEAALTRADAAEILCRFMER